MVKPPSSLRIRVCRKLDVRTIASDSSSHSKGIPRLSGSLRAPELVPQFRERFFEPELPVLIPQLESAYVSHSSSTHAFTALLKWFPQDAGCPNQLRRETDRLEYLSKFADTIVPYELTRSRNNPFSENTAPEHCDLSNLLNSFLASSDGENFHRFEAPLALFLGIQRTAFDLGMGGLYIAQAQISSLPIELQEDLLVPRVVKESGKGDIYDANLWMGRPPTYTPLHKDPNPNLFVQIHGRKKVRLFEPRIGASIFREVQRELKANGCASMRGSEMMDGPERATLENVVWGSESKAVNWGDASEVEVGKGDALFIPKGWWHSVKSVGDVISVSANWWFR